MASKENFEAIVAALPPTGHITYKELRGALRDAGQYRAIDDIHEAKRAGLVHTGLRQGEMVVSLQPIEREKRETGLSAGK